jgi:hypothetical protein
MRADRHRHTETHINTQIIIAADNIMPLLITRLDDSSVLGVSSVRAFSPLFLVER